MASKKEQARQRAARLRAEAEERARLERRRERLLRFGVSAAVLVAAVVLVLFLVRDDGPEGTGAIPTGATASGIVVGEESAPITIDYWFDFQCPFCGQFEAESGPVLEDVVADGTARVAYHPAAFLGEESDRASNAFGCAIDAGRPVEYLTELFENQPPERSGGYTDDDLVEAGAAIGLDDPEFESCVRDGTYADWGSRVREAFRDAGHEATPTVLINGEELEGNPVDLSAEEFRAAVDAAAAGSPQ
ncbi:DsbA family protein [Jiangella asiatica]|uniref:Disulfide bond formation protein DsbA n=1 Tax=Jiangella asiatica TaxID=2530372 RepID=A0A4R5D497_9ACTN|nr:thioredoxin domain-containing protein [Jiangella asiatica]TDE08106.1 disulfide bond formation protein DsbA [Jiangella asiatica]